PGGPEKACPNSTATPRQCKRHGGRNAGRRSDTRPQEPPKTPAAPTAPAAVAPYNAPSERFAPRVNTRGPPSMRWWYVASAAVGLLALSSCRSPAPPPAPPPAAVAVGDKIDGLRFKDIHFHVRSLEDFGKRKAYVLVFIDTACPLAP